MRILGIDFTSAPRRAKPIVCAAGRLRGDALAIDSLERFEDFAGFEALLRRPGPWTGGFDLPFGLPCVLREDLGWSGSWLQVVARCARLSRLELRAAFDAYRMSRPFGSRYAHRATDRPAGSSSPMKLVNPPVALMFHEGAPRLASAGLHIPLLCNGDRSRVALETYPGLLARSIVKASYKNDSRAKQTPARSAARRAIVTALERGAHPLELTLALTPALRRAALADASGDTLDAILCALQAAWASLRPNWGLPARVPRGEGWIVSAVPA
jgi:hypothetical protein